MKCIVTGSEGFIGQHLCRLLESQGHEVVRVDLALGNDVSSQMPPADMLFHLAANPSAPGREFRNICDNKWLADYVCEWHANNPGATIVFASTWMVAIPCDYGCSKLEAEHTLLHCIPRDKLRIIRLRNVYGPGGHGVLDIWRQQIAEGKPITIHGDGSQGRQFIHVDDVVRVLADPPEAVLSELACPAWTLNEIANYLGAEVSYVPARDSFPEINKVVITSRLRELTAYVGAEGAGKP